MTGDPSLQQTKDTMNESFGPFKPLVRLHLGR